MKNKISDYKVCEGKNGQELDTAIEKARQEGWAVHGYPSVDTITGTIIQVMVKYKFED